MVVASLEIIERLAKVGEMPVRLGGIGGVATHPDWRRRGFASLLMQKAALFLKQEIKVDFGLLVCGEQRTQFYAGLGWQVVKGPLLIDQPSGKMALEAVIMVLPCAQQTWPEGIIDLCGLPW
jgi:aminoglycoside 2'-N-acetyltransferase I